MMIGGRGLKRNTVDNFYEEYIGETLEIHYKQDHGFTFVILFNALIYFAFFSKL